MKLLLSLTLLLFSTFIYANKAVLLHVNGAIGPAVQDYILRGIEHATQQKASLVILKLNTPGGIETAMRGINEGIISSAVPIATFVAPQGARAASAGTFIMYASHFSAMAPGTNIGAASPVQLFNEKNTQKEASSVAETKAMNDAAAYIRSLAQLRNRNVQWAEQAVRQAVSISADEAYKLHVIDVIADNEADLLAKLNGKTTKVRGITIQLNTQNITLETKEPDWRYQFLTFLTNPNVAYILMLIAMYGLFFELANPGSVLPGVTGIIALLLVLYAFQLLPINYTGLALLLIGIGFMLFEIYVSSFGVLGVGGIIAFIIGSIMLFDIQDPHFQLMWQLILIMSMLTGLFFFMGLSLVLRSHKKPVVTGAEGLIGYEGTVLSIMNEQIVVRVAGEIWSAISASQLHIGDRIRVTKIEGLTLHVSPIRNRSEK